MDPASSPVGEVDQMPAGGGQEDSVLLTPKKAALQAAMPAAQKVSRATRAVQITDRDIRVIRFLGRYRMATYAQIASAFNVSESALRHRLPRLAREGLLVRRNVGHLGCAVWLPTNAGMRLAQMDLPTPTVSWATAVHTLGLVEIGLKFEALGCHVVTEREIRAADTRDSPSDRMQSAIELLDIGLNASPHLYVVKTGDGSEIHIPDMVLVGPAHATGAPKSIAIELELTAKTQARWREILVAYQKAPHIGRVVYYTPIRKIANGILTAANETGTTHMVAVRRFEVSGDSLVALSGK